MQNNQPTTAAEAIQSAQDELNALFGQAFNLSAQQEAIAKRIGELQHYLLGADHGGLKVNDELAKADQA